MARCLVGWVARLLLCQCTPTLTSASQRPQLSLLPQLFAPASAADEAAVAAAAAAGTAGPAAQLLSYPDGLDSWPERMRPLVQWGEAANMRDRVPLHSRLLELAGGAGGEHPLLASRIADLHPISWWAPGHTAPISCRSAAAGASPVLRSARERPCSRDPAPARASHRPPSCAPPCLPPPARRFAVAWYPLYRVPEAPLTARFLTFHTLASL